MDYLKIGKASELSGSDRLLYRALEMLPGFLSWVTLLGLVFLSFTHPVFVSVFVIAFDVYWLLLVIYLGIHLLAAYKRMREALREDWSVRAKALPPIEAAPGKHIGYDNLLHLVVLPTYNEGLEVLRPTFAALVEGAYPAERLAIILALEERAGPEAIQRAEKIRAEFGHRFRFFAYTVHPDGIEGEIKGKGANQAWAAKELQQKIIPSQGWDKDAIIVSVFDIDTIIYPQYFEVLSYRFLSAAKPYRSSYQPIPVYHNNIWEAPFFARIAAASNTFWQMMQQIRQEKLATYSSHSMTWRALEDIGFWSTTMVSEDSRIFWHCFCHYHGDYTVEPLYYPVSMDACMDRTFLGTARNLYKQQRRWGWGVENVPYLIFNTIKNWHTYPRGPMFSRILVQLYGFHSWATNALIIGFIGWLPLLVGGDQFNSSVLSANLPLITRTLMTLAMSGLILSAALSTVLLPESSRPVSWWRKSLMSLQWIVLPVSIIVFGSIPGLEAQTRLMFGRYMGFWVTPKVR